MREGLPGSWPATALQELPQGYQMLGSSPEGGVNGGLKTRIWRFETFRYGDVDPLAPPWKPPSEPLRWWIRESDDRVRSK